MRTREVLGGGTEYYHEGRWYDERSAHHNGIIGQGALLKEIIKKENENGDRDRDK